MVDPTKVKLGKLARKFDPRIRAIAPASHTWPPAPAAVDWGASLVPPLGVMLNDQLGCCTASAKGHAIQTWSSLNNPAGEITVSDADILALYEKSCGYDPADPATDQGGIMTNVAAYWLAHPIAGHKLSAMASVAPGSRTDVKCCVWLFGGIDAGVQLPSSCMEQSVWAVPAQGPRGSGEPGSWGGHDIWIMAYDDAGLTCITWGEKQKLTWEFWDTYCDEAYAYLSPDWFALNDLAPPNFRLKQLETYLNEFR